MSQQYRSAILASVHETAEGLHEAGLMDKCTMHRLDHQCLTAVIPLTPEEVRAIRLKKRARQAAWSLLKV